MGYESADFEFVVACMSLGTHDVRVADITPPFEDNDLARKKDQVIMHLLIYENGVPITDTRGVFVRLRKAYQSNTMLANPRTLFENQRTLRSMIIEAKNSIRRFNVQGRRR